MSITKEKAKSRYKCQSHKDPWVGGLKLGQLKIWEGGYYLMQEIRVYMAMFCSTKGVELTL